MNFSQTYLGKSLEELTYKDIEEFFIEEQVETETLEFKSGELFKTINEFKDSLNKNINRSITAFLNSSGGLLIWGAPREYKKDGTNIKYCKGELYPINISRDKDSLISEITRAISHMPIGIKVKILSSEDGKSHIYIFEVKESQSKPHQSNHRYFIRLDGQTQDAPHLFSTSTF